MIILWNIYYGFREQIGLFVQAGNCNPTFLSMLSIGHLLSRTADKTLKYHLSECPVIELLTDIQSIDCYFHDSPALYLHFILMGGHIMTLKWRHLKSLRLIFHTSSNCYHTPSVAPLLCCLT